MRHRYARALITGMGGQDGAFLAAQAARLGIPASIEENDP